METANAQTTVLIVEDEILIRMSSMAILEDAGFGVLEAGSAAEALRVLQQRREISILMTDVRLPGEMDGLDLVACVRRSRPEVRALVVSGNSSSHASGNAGAFGFISKPYMAHSLVNAVRKLLEVDAAPLGRTV